jgi:hypothetical protein
MSGFPSAIGLWIIAIAFSYKNQARYNREDGCRYTEHKIFNLLQTYKFFAEFLQTLHKINLSVFSLVFAKINHYVYKC